MSCKFTCSEGLQAMYDVFISHRSENKPWAKALARNLTACGLRPWLDLWEMPPGDFLAARLHDGLRDSRCGILLATPGAFESGWVQTEYEAMLAHSHAGSHLPPQPTGQRQLPVLAGSRRRLPR
ncbi:MAG: toll/interleukin-1 receptor domain-containing protein [Candidatus Methylumidiphilus sp.]